MRIHLTASDTAHGAAHFANGATGEEPAPPAEGPAYINANLVYIPTPLLRSSAASSPYPVSGPRMRRR